LIVDEVRAQVATVELHTFNHFQLVLQATTFFYGDYAVGGELAVTVRYTLHGISNNFADAGVAVGRNSGDLLNSFAIFYRSGQLFQLFNDGFNRFVDAALQVHRVHASGDGLQAFGNDGLSQNCGSGGAVTGFVVGLGSDFLDHLRAHVLELVFQFDFFGNGNTVFGDQRGTEGFFQYHVTAFRAEGDFYCVSQNIDAAEHTGAAFVTKNYFFSHGHSSLG